MFLKTSLCAASVILPLMISGAALANGVGEGRSYQFRSDNQRQVMLAVERTHLELLGLLGGSGAGGLGGGGSGQTGNASSIVINGNNNTVTVDQTNSGSQTQTSDCSSSSFNLGGSMFGC